MGPDPPIWTSFDTSCFGYLVLKFHVLVLFISKKTHTKKISGPEVQMVANGASFPKTAKSFEKSFAALSKLFSKLLTVLRCRYTCAWFVFVAHGAPQLV